MGWALMAQWVSACQVQGLVMALLLRGMGMALLVALGWALAPQQGVGGMGPLLLGLARAAALHLLVWEKFRPACQVMGMVPLLQG